MIIGSLSLIDPVYSLIWITENYHQPNCQLDQEKDAKAGGDVWVLMARDFNWSREALERTGWVGIQSLRGETVKNRYKTSDFRSGRRVSIR